MEVPAGISVYRVTISGYVVDGAASLEGHEGPYSKHHALMDAAFNKVRVAPGEWAVAELVTAMGSNVKVTTSLVDTIPWKSEED